MVMLGHSSTVPVTLDEMIFLTRAVTRAARRPLVVGDLPFGSYEVSDEQAVASAIRMVKEGGADVVKLEGAGPMLSRVRAIAESNIGVMGHVGLTPQSATKLGGFKAQGRTADAAKQLYDDALALQEAGAFAIVLEAVPAPVAARVTEALRVPTIGIGAGAATRRPGARLARHARDVRRPDAALRQALRRDRATRSATRSRAYAADVRTGAFPEEKHTYGISAEELARFEAVAQSVAERRRASSDRRAPSAERGRGAASAPTSSRAPRARRSRAARPTSARKPSDERGERRGRRRPLSRPPLRNTSSP